jgi:hypothetical protein
MTSTEADWLGEHPSADARLIDGAPGGSLSERGRQAAVEASLTLLGLYFSGGEQELAERAAISLTDADIELDALRAGLRLRVALAATRRLMGLLDAVARRPTFRYELRSTDHAGSLSGALDINRWITRPHGGNEDLTFPVIEVTRGSRTPENTLACHAARWLIGELHSSFAASVASRDAAEYHAVRRARQHLEHAIRTPALANCRTDADAIRTHIATELLVTEVRRRLRRREIANPAPYRDLVDWIDACLHGSPAVDPGAVDLTVYGTRFDNKLYELWCLGALGRALAKALNLPEPTINPAWRHNTAAYTFHNFVGRIEVFFQRSLSSIDDRHVAQWKKPNGRRLGGIPDIVIKACSASADPRYAVIDPKLRQRDRLPAEELYKILGYLQNFTVNPPIGTVLIYTTSVQSTKPDVFSDGRGGTLMSVALNPAAPAAVTDAALDQIVRVVLGLIDYEPPSRPNVGGDGTTTTSDEQTEEEVAAAKLSVANWGRSHLAEIAPSRERIETLVGEDRWKALSNDVQVMMATADLVGHQLDPIADFSGPVIGMCAAVEYLLYEGVVRPVVGNDQNRERQMRTLGAVLDAVELACRGRGGVLQRDVRSHLLGCTIDIDAVAALLPAWRRMNSAFRIPAAHRQVLTKSDWQRLYRLVMGSETLFIRTYDGLKPA